MALDLSNYTVEELFESFENIDDLAYPERALLVLKQLLNLSGLSKTQVLDLYKNGDVLSAFGSSPVLSMLASEVVKDNIEIVAKLKRLFVKL